MKRCFLVFPHQLFRDVELLKSADLVQLIEEPLFFGDDTYPVNFHVQKKILHRASMQYYKDYLLSHNIAVEYLSYAKSRQGLAQLFADDITDIDCYDPNDYILAKRLQQAASEKNINLIIHDTPNFYLSNGAVKDYFQDKNTWYFSTFYQKQRKDFEILLTPESKPVGGKWSFDTENRQKLPKGSAPPGVSGVTPNKYVDEAKDYVSDQFPDSLGVAHQFIYPVTHEDADRWFDDFVAQRLHDFGPYEDAIDIRDDHLYHSVLTPALNIGLLSPRQVVNRILDYAEDHKVPLNSLEGFIRQILGWREYMRGIYQVHGTTQRTANHFGFSNKLNERWYTANTELPPMDDLIIKLSKGAYGHHIERLMIAGNLMLLCMIDPDEVYKWFMEFFIDAYDWVMVPNVYGMSQYADGGKIVTKPYISSSNYIRKMSHYPKGEWADTWDALYWNFIYQHRAVFADNYRMKFMLGHLEKKSSAEITDITKRASSFIQQVTT
jgi:deoxyribodipyrimidine photolyase-related protein